MDQPQDNARLMTQTQVADVLGVSVRTVRRRIRSGDLRAARIGRFVRIQPSQLQAFIDAHPAAQGVQS